MEPYIATIMAFGFNYAPRGWCFADGRLLPISQYSAVFALVGTYYGGNGQVTFGVPDLRSRTAVGMGQSPGNSMYTIGETTGTENTTILVSNMPAHSHALMASNQAAAAAPHVQPSNGDLLSAPAGEDANLGAVTVQVYGPNTPNVIMSPQSIGPSGNGIPINNLQPLLAINYSFALEGIFPSRN